MPSSGVRFLLYNLQPELTSLQFSDKRFQVNIYRESHKMKVFVALLVVVSSVAAQYGGPQSYGGPQNYGGHQSYGGLAGGHGGYGQEDYAYVEPHYSFAYEVHDSHTGDIKSHKEERKGEHTQGVYYLVEPDGSRRTVEYLVEGKSGFNAKVLREGSKHPSGGYKSGYSNGGYGNGGLSSGGYSNGGLSSVGYSNGGYGNGGLSSGGYSNGGYSNGGLSSGGYSNGGYSNGGLSSGGYSNGGYSSGGYGGATSSSSFSTYGSLNGGYSQPAYKPSYQPSYQPAYRPSYSEPAYRPSYSEPSYSGSSYKPSYGGQATSSVSIATHGAKIATQTYHAAPSKHY